MIKLYLATELARTEPDYVVYVPRSLDGSSGDTGNEHFLVFDGPDGSLMAVWTQSTYEGSSDQRIVFAHSIDEGVTWTAPKILATRDKELGIGMASWGFPLVSASGRITVIYSRHVGLNDVSTHVTGKMACIMSDDCGETWSPETTLPMPRSIRDNPDPRYPGNWIVWQKPERLSGGKYLCGFRRWTSLAVRSEVSYRFPTDDSSASCVHLSVARTGAYRPTTVSIGANHAAFSTATEEHPSNTR